MRTICTNVTLAAVAGLALAACQAHTDSVATCYGVGPAVGDMDQCAVVRTTSTRQSVADRQIVESQFAAELRQTCMSYGLQPGSQLYANCLVREAELRRPTNYAGHFAQAGERYDQKGNRVDAQGYLVDRNGTRIGGRGYWTKDPNATVPPGTYVDSSGQAIMAPPPRTVSYSTWR